MVQSRFGGDPFEILVWRGKARWGFECFGLRSEGGKDRREVGGLKVNGQSMTSCGNFEVSR
jgi:hypothetical protein